MLPFIADDMHRGGAGNAPHILFGLTQKERAAPGTRKKRFGVLADSLMHLEYVQRFWCKTDLLLLLSPRSPLTLSAAEAIEVELSSAHRMSA